MSGKNLSRRAFIGLSAATVAGCAHLPFGKGRSPAIIHTKSPSEKLNVAAIGCGGRAQAHLMGIDELGENIIALCDVDDRQTRQARQWFPKAATYRDFRTMLEKHPEIDAVTIGTPDHTHFVAAMAAMEMGKHVYVEKPLTYSIGEARELLNAARKYRVATQMGNQGHSEDGVRDLCEMIWDDAIGDVTEVYCWTDRPIWPQGMKKPLPLQDVPDNLDWDLWIGPAPMRPYNDGYAPFNWRGWWDFGCGALGDMGCHIMDPPYWALLLAAPTSVECIYQEGNTTQAGPTRSTIKYDFPARQHRGKTLPPVTLWWYDGVKGDPWEQRPAGIPKDVELGDGGSNGSLFIGSKGAMTAGCYGGNPRFIPEEMGKSYTKPDPYLPRVGGPFKDWVNACKGGGPACSRFEYSVPLTETVLLGNVALRHGGKVEWDASKLRIPNAPAAEQYLKRAYRQGW